MYKVNFFGRKNMFGYKKITAFLMSLLICFLASAPVNNVFAEEPEETVSETADGSEPEETVPETADGS